MAKSRNWTRVVIFTGLWLIYPIVCLIRFCWCVFDCFLCRFFHKKKELIVFFDCKYCPPDYDAIGFFNAAELMRQQKKCDSISVIFRYVSTVRFSVYNGAVVDNDWYRWRFNNIVLNALHLFPKISSFSVEQSRWRAIFKCLGAWNVFPFHPLALKRIPYHTVLRIVALNGPNSSNFHGIRVPIAAKRYVEDWIKAQVEGKKLITITLRHSPFAPKRNSNIREWAQFARSIDPSLYFIAFIMDTDTVMKGYPAELGGFSFFDAASWNLSMRAAIYEKAYLNLFTSGGTFTLCAYNPRARFLLFKIIVNDEPQASEAVANVQGYVKNQNMPGASSYQKFVWEDDVFPVITREFCAMCAKIEANHDNIRAKVVSHINQTENES